MTKKANAAAAVTTVNMPELDKSLGRDLKKIAKTTNLPFVIRNFCPEIKDFGMDFFANQFGDQEVDLLCQEKTTDANSPIVNCYSKEKLRDYIGKVQAGTTGSYMAQALIREVFPKMYEQTPLTDLIKSHKALQFNVWLGPKKTLSKLHYDSTHNYFVQAQGKKIMQLIAPWDSKDCYLYGKSYYDGYSKVETYPQFRNVTIYRVEVNPGDLVFIPDHWWHDIISKEASVSYNIWWATRPQLAREIIGDLTRRVRYSMGMAPVLENKNSVLYTLVNDTLKAFRGGHAAKTQERSPELVRG